MSTLVRKVALVTGGSRGIGLAIARALPAAGRRGRDHRHQPGRTSTRRRLRWLAMAAAGCWPSAPTSGATTRSRRRLPAGRGSVSAGSTSWSTTPASACSDRSPRRPSRTGTQVIDTNLSGVFYCCHAALPRAASARRRLDHQHQQPRQQERLRQRRRLLRLEVGAQRLQRDADAGGPLRRHPRLLRAAGIGQHRLRRPDQHQVGVGAGAGGRGARWSIDLVAHPSRSLPSRVEIRPAQPARKG